MYLQNSSLKDTDANAINAWLAVMLAARVLSWLASEQSMCKADAERQFLESRGACID